MRRLAALIIPAALRDAGNQLAVALGHDEADPPNTYNIPLYPIGETEPSHYGTTTPVTAGFEALIVAAQQGTYPSEWPPELLALAQSVVAGLIADFIDMDSMTPVAHFDSVAAAHGLVRWADEPAS